MRFDVYERQPGKEPFLNMRRVSAAIAAALIDVHRADLESSIEEAGWCGGISRAYSFRRVAVPEYETPDALALRYLKAD